MLTLHVPDVHRSVVPQDTVQGEATWWLDNTPRWVEVRLFWHTEGKGTTDVQVVQRQRFESPGAHETRPFSLTLPDCPYSFSGRLISLVWSVELVCSVAAEAAPRVDLVMSPSGREIRIDQRD